MISMSCYGDLSAWMYSGMWQNAYWNTDVVELAMRTTAKDLPWAGLVETGRCRLRPELAVDRPVSGQEGRVAASLGRDLDRL